MGSLDIFFKKDRSKKKERFESSGSRESRERLELDQDAIEKIIADVLGGPQGLASIFAGEQSAGIFDSSVAAQASGDLVAKLVGELAKLTAERITSEEFEERGVTRSNVRGLEFGAEATGESSDFFGGITGG